MLLGGTHSTSAISAIVLVALMAIAIWGLVVILSNPFVQAILAIMALIGFLGVLRRMAEE